MRILLIIVIAGSITAFSQKKKVKYKYKKYESFNFENLDVDGSSASPGDLSISPRMKKKFKNKIPERKSFNKEILKSIDAII